MIVNRRDNSPNQPATHARKLLHRGGPQVRLRWGLLHTAIATAPWGSPALRRTLASFWSG